MDIKSCGKTWQCACILLAWTSFVIGIMVCSPGCHAAVHNRTQAISEVLDHLLDGYNKELRPGIGGDRIVVETAILIKSMGPISEHDMSYSMQIYFRQKWMDERLSFYLPNVTEFTLSNRFMQDIWKPNSYFLNGRDSKQHNLTVPNAFVRLRYDGSIYVSMRYRDFYMPEWPCVVSIKWIHNHAINSASALVYRDVGENVKERLMTLFHEGHSPATAHSVLKQEAADVCEGQLYQLSDRQKLPTYNDVWRLTVNARCPMMLSRYPMDQAVCPLFIASFGYTTEEIIYKWMKEVEIDPGVRLSQFELGRIRQKSISKTSKFGEFSILEVYIHLTRAVGFYILQTYVPCYLIVSISWVSFWINRDAAPARVLLGVTTILSTSTICMTVREGLPRVPYATALDVFINVCIVYEMAALMEYAAVNYYTKLMPKEVSSDEDEDEAAVVMSVRYSKGSISNQASGSNSACGPNTCNESESNSEEKTPEKITLLTEHCNPDPEIMAPRNSYQGVFPKKKKRQDFKGVMNSMWRCLVGKDLKPPTQTADTWTGTSVSHIDMMARIYFPLTFGLFNVAYWIVYIYLEIS